MCNNVNNYIYIHKVTKSKHSLPCIVYCVDSFRYNCRIDFDAFV